MRNRKNSIMLAALVGLIAVVGIGAWLLMGDDGRANSKPLKPTAEVGAPGALK